MKKLMSETQQKGHSKNGFENGGKKTAVYSFSKRYNPVSFPTGVF
jgi:hypothetical protein